jgi:hypothetical protein
LLVWITGDQDLDRVVADVASDQHSAAPVGLPSRQDQAAFRDLLFEPCEAGRSRP